MGRRNAQRSGDNPTWCQAVPAITVLLTALSACVSEPGAKTAWDIPLAPNTGVVMPAAFYDAESPDGRWTRQVARACDVTEGQWTCTFLTTPWADSHHLWLTTGDRGCDADTWAAAVSVGPAEKQTSSAPCTWPFQFWNEAPLDGTSSQSNLTRVDPDQTFAPASLRVTWPNGTPVSYARAVLQEPDSGILFAGDISSGVLVPPAASCPAQDGDACRLPHGVAFDVRVYLTGDLLESFSSWKPGDGSLVVSCLDADRDGHCLGGGDDCDDNNPNVYPGATEIPYNGADDDCSGSDLIDLDQDGFDATIAGGDDCDDNNPNVYPGATESCNGVDDDCDGIPDDGLPIHAYLDQDGDGFGTSDQGRCGPDRDHVPDRGDCDDHDPGVHPGAEDPPGDGVDQDCGGEDGPQPHVGLSAASSPTIADAIAAASPEARIWVGPGTYQEANLEIVGTSVQLLSTRGPETTIIDARQEGPILSIRGATAAPHISGFTFTGGVAPQGGALQTDGASPRLEQLILIGNLAETAGGGFLLSGGNPLLIDVHATGNLAPTGRGGGGAVESSTTATFDHVVLEGNEATAGGGLHVAGTVIATTVRFQDNTADIGGGCFVDHGNLTLTQGRFAHNTARQGAGLDLDHATATISNTLFSENSATEGGGIYFGSASAEIDNAWFERNSAHQGAGVWLFRSSPMFVNCVFLDNTADAEGGAAYSDGSFAGFVHSVLARNRATTGGGLFTIDTGMETWSPFLVNSIATYNTAFNLFDDLEHPDPPTVIYSALFNGDAPNHNLPSLDDTVLELDPDFLVFDPSGGNPDFHLEADSPLVDAGDPSVYDADGSPADIGCYGWEHGATWDRDADGWPDYFWPGLWSSPPPEVDPHGWDPDDRDPEVPGLPAPE